MQFNKEDEEYKECGWKEPMLDVRFKKTDEMGQIPKYAKASDAGLDLVAVSKERTVDYTEYGIGLAVEIPEGYVGLIFPRSSISNYDLSLANAVGVIDSGYRGEIKCRFKNSSTIQKLLRIIAAVFTGDSWEPFEYEISDKVAQLVIMPYPKINPIESDSLSASDRGTGGFGSTGK